MNYILTELIKGVFLLEFNSRYDLAMHFCRYQEFYESQNPDFRGKSFLMNDFKRWYATENTNRIHKDLQCFTYPADWAGFNVPSWVFDKLQNLGIKDMDRYDQLMFTLHVRLKDESGGKYYLIGACQGKLDVISHEIAHGLYYSNQQYKKEMSKLITLLAPVFLKKLYGYLEVEGYPEMVFQDEAQAHLSTGFSERQLKNLRKDFNCNPTGVQNTFEVVYKKYAHDIPILKEYFAEKV